ncbi:hypothetical protein ACRYCC_22060 [Actinomadura scrupuli]|uniref:hypothetical protein n=1 Tax=Actinomadura scrupuli TaxID=559629 RepID=UPI003D98D6BE
MSSPSASEPLAKTPDVPGRASILVTALNRRGQERFSGTLSLAGDPGGTVTMRDGLVVAAATPAAPGPEALLLRSGRVTEADWSEAFAAAAPYGRLSAELVDRELLGAAGVEVVAQVALVDAIFAMALCGVHTCTAATAGSDDLAPLLPVVPGMEIDRLIRETVRRLTTAVVWQGLGLTVRSRPHAIGTDPARREILERANGRRTARDLAFALGRGLYSVMTDLAALIEDGLVEVTGPPAGTRAPRAVPATGGDPAPAQELPRRHRGAALIDGVFPGRTD